MCALWQKALEYESGFTSLIGDVDLLEVRSLEP